MQKLFLLSLIIACLAIPVRRASSRVPVTLGRVMTDFFVFMLGFAIILRFVYGRIPS